jgi:hypothetical protein
VTNVHLGQFFVTERPVLTSMHLSARSFRDCCALEVATRRLVSCNHCCVADGVSDEVKVCADASRGAGSGATARSTEESKAGVCNPVRLERCSI